jgi:sec-independent protein translocase protein TatA
MPTVSTMTTMLAFGLPGPTEMIIIGVIVLLLFGTRLPSVMRSLGIGITEFRKGIKGEIDEDGNTAIEDKDTEEKDNKDQNDSTSSKETSSTTV